MGVLAIKENKVIFQKRNELAVIEPWGKDCLRFRASPNARLTDEKLEPYSSAGDQLFRSY